MSAAAPVVFDTRVVTGSGGGPDKTILNSPRFFEPLGYRMLCGYLYPPNDPGYAEIQSKAVKYHAPLISIPDRGPFDMKVVSQLLKVCRDENVAIWHGHDYKTNALGLALRKFHKMKLVTTVHGWVHHTKRTPLYYKIDKYCLKRYELVFSVSGDLHRTCSVIGVKPDKNILLENGIDTVEYTRKQPIEAAKKQLGFDPARILIGAAGRLEPEKAFDLLIRALPKLPETVDLAIIGEGGDRPRLESIIVELGLQSRVKLAGWQSDVKSYFEAMDLFALSSLREGLPNVLLEAMALEVPCVATRIAGIPKLITDAIDGSLIEPGDLDSLTTGLKTLVLSPGKRAEFAHAARNTILNRYSFAKRIEAMAAAYDRLLGVASR